MVMLLLLLLLSSTYSDEESFQPSSRLALDARVREIKGGGIIRAVKKKNNRETNRMYRFDKTKHKKVELLEMEGVERTNQTVATLLGKT